MVIFVKAPVLGHSDAESGRSVTGPPCPGRASRTAPRAGGTLRWAGGSRVHTAWRPSQGGPSWVSLPGPLPHALRPRWGVGVLAPLEIPGEALLEPAAPWNLHPSKSSLFPVPSVELPARTCAAPAFPRGPGRVPTLHGGRLSLWPCPRQAQVVALTWPQVVLCALPPPWCWGSWAWLPHAAQSSRPGRNRQSFAGDGPALEPVRSTSAPWAPLLSVAPAQALNCLHQLLPSLPFACSRCSLGRSPGPFSQRGLCGVGFKSSGDCSRSNV